MNWCLTHYSLKSRTFLLETELVIMIKHFVLFFGIYIRCKQLPLSGLLWIFRPQVQQLQVRHEAGAEFVLSQTVDSCTVVSGDCME